jgi:hypothetical protein
MPAGEEPAPQLRRSPRLVEKSVESVLHVSLTRALATFGDADVDAVRKEISQLLRRKVWTPLHAAEKAPRAVIPSQLFLRDKRDAAGSLLKVKGRLVAGGHRQARDGESNASPTIATEALLTLVGVAASRNHHVAAIDVEAAYLEVDMDAEVYMRLDRDIADHIVTLEPLYGPLRRNDRSIVVTVAVEPGNFRKVGNEKMGEITAKNPSSTTHLCHESSRRSPNCT